MFGRKIHLFTLLGFEVNIDPSWLIIAFLVAWSLSANFFPYFYEDLSTGTYWGMGIIGALGLFLSILFHEFWHSIVARRFDIPMKGITLFLFGGVSEMHKEPEAPKDEFFMAIAGPISSVVLGFAFFGVYRIGQAGAWPVPVVGVLSYLAFINWIVAGFNMMPAFPLDGGRVLRSALWAWKKDLRKATRWASQAGSFFGVALIVLGVINLFSGNLVGGVWYFVIGLFIQAASKSSYRQLLMKNVLQDKTVGDLMRKNPVTVPASISLRELVEDYVYTHHFKMFPVTENDRLQGCVTTRQIKEVPKEQWDTTRVKDIAGHCDPENTVSPDTNAAQILSRIGQSGTSRLMVVSNGQLHGVITLKDLAGYLSSRMDLEDESELPPLRP